MSTVFAFFIILSLTVLTTSSLDTRLTIVFTFDVTLEKNISPN